MINQCLSLYCYFLVRWIIILNYAFSTERSITVISKFVVEANCRILNLLNTFYILATHTLYNILIHTHRDRIQLTATAKLQLRVTWLVPDLSFFFLNL